MKQQHDMPNPVVAIVIPAFKHAGLLPEAVESALKQETEFDYAIILVNDGCPYAETDTICLQYAIAYPDKIFYLHKPNGGLSSARNAGIEFSLQAFPALEAIYFLDADNRIGPLLLQKSLTALRNAPSSTGWIYPDIHKFGMEEFCDMSGRYHALEHLISNMCEAGSLVRREVFASGIRYDETMRNGYEDWEFWLQCIEAGYEGLHVPALGFFYRQRAESMLREAERQHDRILHVIHQKHERLFSLPSLLDLEHKTLKRYALFQGGEQISYVSDFTQASGVPSAQTFLEDLQHAAYQPAIDAVPGYLLCCSAWTYEHLQQYHLLQGLVWRLQSTLTRHALACLHISYGHALIGLKRLNRPPEMEPSLLLCHSADLRQSGPFAEAIHFQLTLPARSSLEETPSALALLSELLAKFSEKKKTSPALLPAMTGIQAQRATYEQPRNWCRALYGVPHLLPVMPGSEKNIGILLSASASEAIKSTAFHYAEALKNHHTRLHLFIIGKEEITPSYAPLWDSITFFDAKRKESNRYFGEPISEYEEEQAIGMLYPMQTILNFQVPGFHGYMPRLRQKGIELYCYGDASSANAFLAYEYAYDGLLTTSQMLTTYFQALGVPHGKLITIPSAPSYPVRTKRIHAIMQERAERTMDHSLRVLFIGSFNRESGFDHLPMLMQSCRHHSLPVSWRMVGGAHGTGEALQMEAFRSLMHPWPSGLEEMLEHLGWADILILPGTSDHDVAILLEAGRLGCIPIATRTPLRTEWIHHGETGFLVDDTSQDMHSMSQMVQCLAGLSSDRRLVERLASQAAFYYGGLTWQRALAPLIQKLGLSSPRTVAELAA